MILEGGRRAQTGPISHIDAYLRSQMYAPIQQDTGRPVTFEAILRAPTHPVIITHVMGGSANPLVTYEADGEHQIELGLAPVLTNVFRALRKEVAWAEPAGLAQYVVDERAATYNEGYIRWMDMRQKEPLMTEGLMIYDREKNKWVKLCSGLIAYTAAYGEKTPIQRVDFLEGIVEPYYDKLVRELAQPGIGFKSEHLTDLLLVSEAGKLFHGLERANACVRDLLHELRGPHYMEDRGERLYGILEEEGSGGRMIHYKYNATRDTWGQTYTVLVPNALATLGDGTQYRAADEKKQKLGTFLNRLGIFGHPFIRASLDIWRETHGK